MERRPASLTESRTESRTEPLRLAELFELDSSELASAEPRDLGSEGSQTPAEELPGEARADRPLLVQLGLDLARTALVGTFVYLFFFHLSVVRGSSMAPGIEDGDRILIEPWSYLWGDVERGDIVVLRYPLDPSVDYIKRVVGLPGDTITMADGHVWVNGELVEEPYVERIDHTSYVSTEVGTGAYFVLGDNRPRSSDSREFGLVPASYLRGRVDLRLWPLSRAGFLR